MVSRVTSCDEPYAMMNIRLIWGAPQKQLGQKFPSRAGQDCVNRPQLLERSKQMRSEVLVASLVGSLPFCLAGPTHVCSCNGFINAKGQGECQTAYRGKQFCYVDKGNCNDQKKRFFAQGSHSFRYWSYEACENYPNYGLEECRGLKGASCQFPFKWDGRIFNNCTTYKSANGAAWCATRVRGHDREAVRGSLEDCSAPCDHGANPYEDCPRNPVVAVTTQPCYNELQGKSSLLQMIFSPVFAASCWWYDHRKHKDGETFPSVWDRCNECVCDSRSGEVICSEKECYGGQSLRQLGWSGTSEYQSSTAPHWTPAV